MADPQTKLVISGDSSGAIKAINETQTALTNASRQMAGALDPLAAGLSKIQGAFAVLGTLLAGGALFKASVSAANDWNQEVGKLAKALGTTTENASVMAVALDHLGISSDAVQAATMGLSKQLKSNEADFAALGIQTRNYATGELLPAGEIMAAANSKLLEQKNGVQQNIDGLKIYGKAWGEARQTLRLTTEQLAEAERRAKDLHLIVGAEGVAMTKLYKEEQRDLALVWKSIEIQMGTALLPALVKLGAFMSGEGPQGAKMFAAALEGVIVGLSITFLSVDKLTKAWAATAAIGVAVLQGNIQMAKDIWEEYSKDADAINLKLSGLVTNYGKQVGAAADDAAKKRKSIEEQLQAKLGDLAHLQAKAARGVTAEILEDDEKRTKAQIANAEKLRDALRSAWQASIEGARKASEESVALLQKAADTRQTAAEKVADIRTAQLSPADQAAIAIKQARDAADEGTQSALLAKLAAQQGRAENAAKLADQATKELERASRAAEKITDPELKISAIQRIAEGQASADEARAKIKQQEAAQLEERAVSQATMIKDLDKQIDELRNKAANVAIQVQIDQATAAVSALQAQLAQLQDKTVTVTVNTVQSSSDSGEVVGGGGSFASGGYTGPGGKWQVAGLVHAGEFVARQEVVRQPGVLEFLSRLNAYGASVIPGYADGGLVSRLQVGSLKTPAAPPQRAAAVFNFPDLGRFPVTMTDDALSRLELSFARVALQKGGRR